MDHKMWLGSREAISTFHYIKLDIISKETEFANVRPSYRSWKS